MNKLVLVSVGLLLTSWCFSAVVFVDTEANGDGNGSSWANAYNHLQDALAVAQKGDEIRVAEGVYRPDRGADVVRGDREATFRLVDGVVVRGGYAGVGRADPDERDVSKYETVLSGDLDGNDGAAFSGYEENSYSVVTTSNIPEHVVGDTVNELDGFTIRGGNADAADTHRGKAYGGGMFCVSEATIIECTFVGNRAVYGGAISCRPSSCCVTEPKLIRCTLEGNAAEKEGGAVYLGDSDVYLDRCRIRGNTAAEKGGAVMFGNDNITTMVNCVIDGNTAGEEGGALFCTFCFGCKFTHCTISGNSAGTRGGAVRGQGESYLTFTSSILWGNTPEEIFLDENGVIVRDSCVQGGWSEPRSTGVIDADPLFVDAPGGDFRLSSGSPCIDTGIADGAPTFDIEGNGRPCGAGVDMGAYELGGCLSPTAFMRGDPNADENTDLSDAVFVLNYLFLGGTAPSCKDAADSDDNGALEITDAVYLLNFLFLGGAEPSAPFPACGFDPTIDELTCRSFEGCGD